MSKRRGDFVTLDDLIAEIGVDATRWFMLSRSHDTTIDLDLDAGEAQSPPTTRSTTCSTRHARIASMLRKAGRAVAAALAEPARRRAHPAERALIKKLLAFPGEVGRGGRAARAAPDRRLRARARAGRSPPSTATARCATPAPTRCARCGSAEVRATMASSPGRWASWGSRRRSRCDRPARRAPAGARARRRRPRSPAGPARRSRPAAPRRAARRGLEGEHGGAAARALGDRGVRDRAAERVGDDLGPRRRVDDAAPGADDRVLFRQVAVEQREAQRDRLEPGPQQLERRRGGGEALDRRAGAVAPARPALAGQQRQHVSPWPSGPSRDRALGLLRRGQLREPAQPGRTTLPPSDSSRRADAAGVEA